MFKSNQKVRVRNSDRTAWRTEAYYVFASGSDGTVAVSRGPNEPIYNVHASEVEPWAAPSSEATASRPDPYAVVRKLDEMVILGLALEIPLKNNTGSNRLANERIAWEKKQAQAREQLDRPLPRKGTIVVGQSEWSNGRRVENSHPANWLADSGEELGHS